MDALTALTQMSNNSRDNRCSKRTLDVADYSDGNAESNVEPPPRQPRKRPKTADAPLSTTFTIGGK